jgi:hypothetical protein
MKSITSRLGRVALGFAAIAAVASLGSGTASASDGDWQFAPPVSVPPGTYATFAPELFCASATCAWTPSMTITANATGGAQFYSNAGAVQEVRHNGTPVGSCTAPTSTTFVCTFTGSGTVATGESLDASFITPVMYGIPAAATAGSTLINMTWQDTPMTGNTNTADDSYTFVVSGDAAVPMVSLAVAGGAGVGALAVGGGILARKRRGLVPA